MVLEKQIAEAARTSATQLFLANHHLTAIPDGICCLQELRTLYLTSNSLVALPENIGSLSKLETLALSENHLTALPASIGELENLRTLYVRNNRLEKLPDSICKLPNLQTLHLQNNRLSVLPEAVGDLKTLKTLSLSGNQLTTLPTSVSQLSSLHTLRLDGNELLESPPAEIISQGVEAVQDFVGQLKGETARLFEAKLLIVGQGDVGKTQLLNRLIDNKVLETTSTEGIDIHHWQIETPRSDQFRINFWDFGGQEIYSATHQFFLTKRSLYLLVWEARSDDDLVVFDYWLNTIKVLSGDSPVLVIQNKIDLGRKAIDQTYWTDLFDNIVEYHDVSAIEGAGTRSLRQAIVREADKLPNIGDELPKKWIEIRAKLESISSNFIPYATYQEICDLYGMEAEQIDRLSQYFNDLGVFLHFAESPVLRDTLFLNPEWATNAVYKVLDNNNVRQNFGRFCFDDLPSIWTDEQQYPKSMYVNLIELMKNFELCFELPQDYEYIVPGLLKTIRPVFEWDYSDNLRFKYEYKFMPAGILARFIVNTHEMIEQDLYWKRGLVLAGEGARALVMRTESRTIEIRIKGGDQRYLSAIIKHHFDRINNTFNNLSVDQMVKCVCDECETSSESHFFIYEKLAKFREKKKKTMECPESGEAVSIDLLLGDTESENMIDNPDFYITNVYGDSYTFQAHTEFNKIEVHNTITNVRKVIDKSTEIDSKTKKKFLEHVDNIFKEFTKDGAKAGAKLGYDALKEYMKNEGIPKALRKAVKVASGGWIG